MSEHVAYWIFGFALSAAITIAVGKQLVADRGRRIVPALCATAVVIGALLGWAIDGFVAYVRLSQTARF